jgi:hypothetical protein
MESGINQITPFCFTNGSTLLQKIISSSDETTALEPWIILPLLE